jgi:hypothetical protein
LDPEQSITRVIIYETATANIHNPKIRLNISVRAQANTSLSFEKGEIFQMVCLGHANQHFNVILKRLTILSRANPSFVSLFSSLFSPEYYVKDALRHFFIRFRYAHARFQLYANCFLKKNATWVAAARQTSREVSKLVYGPGTI